MGAMATLVVGMPCGAGVAPVSLVRRSPLFVTGLETPISRDAKRSEGGDRRAKPLQFPLTVTY